MSSSSAAATGSPATEPSLFVINLCASTTPMALVHPSNPELKRYTFFVTRQREEGRERFRLHMGYFASLFEAETLLGAVRDVYPAAWAGPAPTSGAPRRGRVAAAVPEASPAPQPAAVEAPAPEPAPASVPVPEEEPAPTLDAMSNVRDVLAQLSDEGPTRLMPVPTSIPTLSESQTLRVLEAPAPATSITLEAAPEPVAEAMPALEISLAPEVAPAPQAKSAPEAQAASRPVAASPVKPAMKPAVKPAVRPRARPAVASGGDDEVRIVTPEDTQTLRDIRLDVERNAPPCFAVQLLWSVTPINITDHPHLAIFDAYTLYNVEGNRQGRKWFGLRLGFFTDPNAATQVAYYVRSDYPTVAVVPVAEKERDRARGHEPLDVPKAAMPKLHDSAPLQDENLAGFELLEDDRPRPPKRDVDDSAPAVPTVQAARKAKAAPVAAPRPAAKPVAKKPTGKRVMVRQNGAGRVTPGAATPLEQTLEILGASTLTLDESREVINDSAIRSPVVPAKKAGRLSRLLNRLGGG